MGGSRCGPTVSSSCILGVPGLLCVHPLHSRGNKGAQRSQKGGGLEPVHSGTGAQTGLDWFTPHCWLRAGVPSDPRAGAGFLWDSWAAESTCALRAGPCFPTQFPGLSCVSPFHAPGQGASLPTAPPVQGPDSCSDPWLLSLLLAPWGPDCPLQSHQEPLYGARVPSSPLPLLRALQMSHSNKAWSQDVLPGQPDTFLPLPC